MCVKAWGSTCSASGRYSDCFSNPLQLPFVFSLAEALSDNEVKTVTVPEGVPDGILKDSACVCVDESKLAPKGAVSSNGWELLGQQFQTHPVDQTLGDRW